MIVEEMKKFVSQVNLALAHTDLLTEELHKHVEFISAKFTNLVDEINN